MNRQLRICILLAVAIAGCAQPVQPDLQRLYESKSGQAAQPPVIVIHGALGSKLRDPDLNIEAWPGRLFELIFGRYTRLTLGIDPTTLEPQRSVYEPVAINQSIVGRDYYGRIMRALDDIGGYRLSEIGTPASPGERRCYIFLYDWRKDAVEIAAELDTFIEQIRKDFGQPTMKVDVVAHSFGGMIARYYVRYGVQDVLDDDRYAVTNAGGRKVRRLVLLGVPNLGSADAVRTLDQGFKVGLGSIPPEATATFPSTYQVLPHPLSPALIDESGHALDADLFDPQFWRDHKLSIFRPDARRRIRGRFVEPTEADAYLGMLARYFDKRLERARRFTQALSTEFAGPTVFPVVFGGDCVETPSRMVLERVGEETFVRLEPDELHKSNPRIDYDRLMLDAGDGTVTKASLLAKQTADPTIARDRASYFPMHHSVFMCDEHTQLTGNIHFQDNLLHTLLSADPLTAPPR